MYKAYLADPISFKVPCNYTIHRVRGMQNVTYLTWPTYSIAHGSRRHVISWMETHEPGRPYVVVLVEHTGGGGDAIEVFDMAVGNCDTKNSTGRDGTAVGNNGERAITQLPATVELTVRDVDGSPYLFYGERRVHTLYPNQTSSILSAIIAGGNERQRAD